MVLGEPLEVSWLVARVFQALGIRYFVGGSLASSLHGVPRATQDADMVAEMNLSQVADFVSALEGKFYVDKDMIEEAIQLKKSFNIIHLATMFKVDVFVLGRDERAQEEMNRREEYSLPDERRELFVASAEDIILEKLRWYELGEKISERQWNDILGVIQVKRNQLDIAYLESRAKKVQLDGLLRLAFDEADAVVSAS